jgi:hypothetical protein
MKIGILTFHRSINYGAFLQSYALSKFIKQQDSLFDVEIIDFQYKKSYNHYLRDIFISTDYFGQYRNYMRYKSFKDILSALPLSEKFIENEVKDVCSYINSRYDMVITGSDAVFGKRKLPNIFWLNGINVKHKASYAASAHGRDFDLISEEQIKLISSSIESFEYLGVRDYETEKMLLSANKEKEVFRNCDPSIFLDINDFDKNLINERKIDFSVPKHKKVIGVMLHDNYINKKIKKKYGKTHFIVSLYRHNPYADIYLYDLNPFEWAKIFSKFDLLVTKYFHGSIFCLKNSVPVIAIDYSKNVDKYCCKLNDLFSRLDLINYYFKRKDIIVGKNENCFFDTIDSLLTNNNENLKNKIHLSVQNEKNGVHSFLNYLHNI